MLRIAQIPGGDVIGVQIGTPCNADPQTRNSIEQAVKRAAPLPYKGYEKVFQRDINFNFSYDG
jgi:colicin import membrane protein